MLSQENVKQFTAESWSNYPLTFNPRPTLLFSITQLHACGEVLREAHGNLRLSVEQAATRLASLYRKCHS